MHKNKIALGLLLALGMSSAASASPTPHLWQRVTATSGNWHAQLAAINEDAWFVTRNGETISSFQISPEQPFEYGFGFNEGADFDLAYTLTVTQQSAGLGFSSKACVYVITAASPAKPDIRVESYNGASCTWSSIPHGQEFMVG